MDNLYQTTILEHGQRPHNFGKPQTVSISREGFNHLCGDKISVYSSKDTSNLYLMFESVSCVICKASASLMTLTINKANPTIVFNDITKNFGDIDFDLVASSNSSGTFSFTVSDTSVAIVSNSTITIIGGGSTTITLNQAEVNNYNAGVATMTLTVNKGTTTIAFNDLTKTYGDPNFDFSATSLSSGAMTFTISNTSIATMVNSTTANIAAVGTSTVEVQQAADSNYNSLTATMTLTIVKADPNISFNDLVKKNYLIYFILIFSYPFIYVYQKYYDPLIFIVILSLVESKFIKDLIENNKINIYLVLMYFFLFLVGSNLYYI